MGKRGPAPKGQYENKTSVLSTRITSELREALEASARQSGRSLSQEIEHRLRRSFKEDRKLVDRFGGRQMYAVFQTAALVAELRLGHGNDVWLRDPHFFDQTLKAIVAVLEQFRPPPDAKSIRVQGSVPKSGSGRLLPKPDPAISKSWDKAIRVVESTAGLRRAREVVETVARSDGSLPVGACEEDAKKLAPYLRDDLGDLAERLDPERVEDALRRASSESAAAWGAEMKRRSAKKTRRAKIGSSRSKGGNDE